MSQAIDYRLNAPLSVEVAIELYRRSTLGERRPVDRPDVFADMLKHANLTVTAWHGERLVAAPKANDYYPQLGFEHNPRAWMLKKQ